MGKFVAAVGENSMAIDMRRSDSVRRSTAVIFGPDALRLASNWDRPCVGCDTRSC